MNSGPIKRLLSLPTNQSGMCFVFSGPSRIGKSHLLKTELAHDLYFDLADFDTFRKLSFQPSFLSDIALPEIKIICVDNIHLMPSIFNQIDHLLKTKSIVFYLTTLSMQLIEKHIPPDLTPLIEVRQLKPLSSHELKEHKNFDLNFILNYGSLPFTINSLNKETALIDYIGALLLKDFSATGKVKKIENFSRFLNSISIINGFEINYEEIGQACSVPGRTVREYFKLLENYELGYTIKSLKLNNYSKVKNKFYYFDIGVSNAFKNDFNTHLSLESYERSLKHFIFLELLNFKHTIYPGLSLNYWSDYKNNTFDFVLNAKTAVVINTTQSTHEYHFKEIIRKLDQADLKLCYFVAQDEVPNTLLLDRYKNKVKYFHIKEFLQNLWSRSLLS